MRRRSTVHRLSAVTVCPARGVVTADHRVGGYAGFYIQTPGVVSAPGVWM